LPKLNPIRVPIRALPPEVRVGNFQEVEQPYTLEEALAEAKRCILCPKPKCVDACPARNDIPGFIKALLDGDFARGVLILNRTNSLPGICSRVCDHFRQCEGACVIIKKGEPIAIGMLERFLADWAMSHPDATPSSRAPVAGKRVAVVGAGPAGLSCADALTSLGHDVTVFDGMPTPGGILAWGIPLFRLPQAVLNYYVGRLKQQGVAFELCTKVGEKPSIDDLFSHGYQGVFLGTGTTEPVALGVPGEDLMGVIQASEFLAKARLSRTIESPAFRSPHVGEHVAVIGAGNTALDAAQTARRLGAQDVTVVYRRSEVEVPARREEVESACQEGVSFRFLTAPVRFVGDAHQLQGMECIQMALGERDSSGRPRPVPIAGSEFLLEVDTVILALGYKPDLDGIADTLEVQRDGGGLILVNSNTMQTSRTGVWAGGDIVNGPDTVVRAVAQGRKAALAIHSYLAGA